MKEIFLRLAKKHILTCNFAANLLIGSPTGNSELSGVNCCEPVDTGRNNEDEADFTVGLQ